MKAEGENTPADIVLTVDISRLSEIDDLGALAAVNSPLLRATSWPNGGIRIITGLIIDAGAVAVVSTERVDANALKRVEDLAKPEWRGRICTRKGSHPYNRALLASLVAHNGPEAAQEWTKGLVANMARKPQGNDRAQANAIHAGLCDIALMNTYYYG